VTNWIPIIPSTDPRATKIWKSIFDISNDVLARHYAPPRVLPRQHSTYEEAILFAYMASGTANPEWAHYGLERLDQAITENADKISHCALFGGWCGLGWTVEHVSQVLGNALPREELSEPLVDNESPDEDPNEEIDTVVIQRLRSGMQPGLFDLIYGLVGFGVYFLERWPAGRSAEGLELVTIALESIAEEAASGTTWHSPPELMPDWQRKECPIGRYDLGVAHGVPGVVHFLHQAIGAGISPGRVSSLLDRTLRWLLAQAAPDRGRPRFGAWVTADGNSKSSRPVWCYGDLGVAAVLFQVGEGGANPTVNAFACDVLDKCLTLPAESYEVSDAGLCHGAAGIAHIYNRMYQAQGDLRFRDAALSWYDRVLAMYKPGTGVGGYSKYVRSEENGAVVWEPWPAFLDGSIGIGLALLGAVTSVEPQWDRALLLSGRRFSSR
jgi:hypothetical protein